MKDYGLPIWLPAQDLRPESVKGYGSVIRAQINRQWGRRRVGEITTPEYDAWRKSLNQKVAAGELSRTYVDEILMVFGMMMTDAVQRYGYRKTSPIVPVSKRRGKYTKKAARKKHPLAISTVYKLAVNAYVVWGFTGWTYIWTAAFTGMRPGEMWGLQRTHAAPAWPASETDLDLRRESLDRYTKMPAVRVQYQHQWVDGQMALTDPKYDSHSTLVLPPFLQDMHEALANSHDSPWMFPAINGGPLCASFERDYWHPVRDGAPAREARRDFARPAIPAVEEMAGLRIYRLRHWMKECLDEDGHSEVAVETRMGHEIAGVRGLYGNLTPKMEQGIVEAQQERWEAFHRAAGGCGCRRFPVLSQLSRAS
jgi:integrase